MLHCRPQTGGAAQYMRHASGQFYGVSAPVARYIKQNAPILHHYANEVLLLHLFLTSSGILLLLWNESGCRVAPCNWCFAACRTSQWAPGCWVWTWTLSTSGACAAPMLTSARSRFVLSTGTSAASHEQLPALCPAVAVAAIADIFCCAPAETAQSGVSRLLRDGVRWHLQQRQKVQWALLHLDCGMLLSA